MERKIAEQIVALVNAHIDQLISSLEPVEAEISPDEFAGYKRGIARVITAYDVGDHRSASRANIPISNPAMTTPSRRSPRTPEPRGTDLGLLRPACSSRPVPGRYPHVQH